MGGNLNPCFANLQYWVGGSGALLVPGGVEGARGAGCWKEGVPNTNSSYLLLHGDIENSGCSGTRCARKFLHTHTH